jgi:hypothetical protein
LEFLGSANCTISCSSSSLPDEIGPARHLNARG